MKKMLAGMMVAGALLLGFAGQSMATTGDFLTGDLIRVVYSPGGTYEYATDLGSLSSLETGLGTTPALISGSSFTGYTGTGYSTLDVTYFVYVGGTTASTDIASATTSGAPVQQKTLTSASGWMAAVSSSSYYGKASNQIQTSPLYTAELGQSNAESYVVKMNGGTTYPGQYGELLTADAESNLGTLGSSGTVAMYLYNFNNNDGYAAPGTQAGSIVSVNGDYFEIITTTGGTELAEVVPAATVPVPPSLLLLAPGLLGLVGLRRKVGK
ncbi:MAG: hypothetical protein ABSD38_22665 [Syntrophorhabdales bacterium]